MTTEDFEKEFSKLLKKLERSTSIRMIDSRFTKVSSFIFDHNSNFKNLDVRAFRDRLNISHKKAYNNFTGASYV